ncbi:MAG: hypothetical protein HY673_26095 [Chloroflexi bacterium]|nr:hypothetical protein [Chloroflexota bacterium]
MAKAPSPRMPRVARVAKVDQLMPVARDMVSRTAANMYEGIEIHKGQKVLFVNDTTADQLVVQALSAAALERGAHVDVITLEGFRGLKDPGEMLDNMFSNNWYPKWVWDAANNYDIVLLMAFIKSAHTPLPDLPNKPEVDNWEITADLMLSDYEKFPVELRNAIDEVAWAKLFNSTSVKWTDLEGTDLTIKLTARDWEVATQRLLKRTGNPYTHGHLMLPAPTTEMNGVWAISSITFGGPVPRTTMTVERGRVVKVQGGGKYGERLRQSFANNKDLFKSKCPGPGVNWITTIGICTNPSARRSPFFDELEGSARVCAWTFGHRRSGVVHTSVGEGLISPTYKIIRHMDNFFSTLVTDKGIVIENGHLTALDDPGVRKLAEKFGDPAKLLREVWIPAVKGVNA